MLKPLLDRWRRQQEARAAARRAIADPLWHFTLAQLPFIARRSEDDLATLRRLTSLFLDQKEFSGAGGLEVDDRIALTIAVQACLPVLQLGLAHYDDFVGIVVHPDEMLVRREMVDDDGVVHEYDEALVGEALSGGPVVLSWHDVAEAGDWSPQGYNVVIHEFAHVLDRGDGALNGMPALPDAPSRARWQAVLAPAYAAFCQAVERGRPSALDPYGAHSIEEFFAVATEAFFVLPADLRDEQPALYRLLADWFRQDPALHDVA